MESGVCFRNWKMVDITCNADLVFLGLYIKMFSYPVELNATWGCTQLQALRPTQPLHPMGNGSCNPGWKATGAWSWPLTSI